MVFGDQVPTIPLGEVAFKVVAVVPLQTLRVVTKLGTIVGAVIVTTKVVLVAHCPVLGVKI